MGVERREKSVESFHYTEPQILLDHPLIFLLLLLLPTTAATATYYYLVVCICWLHTGKIDNEKERKREGYLSIYLSIFILPLSSLYYLGREKNPDVGHHGV